MVPDDPKEAADFLDNPSEVHEPSSTYTSLRDLVLKLKGIVQWFRSSEVAMGELRTMQRARGRPLLELIQEVR